MATEKQKKRIPLPESKIQVPAAPKNSISRETLINRIEKGEERTVVFQAESGFGKTTVMAELARKYDGECGWYRLDELDNDPDRFLYGIGSAIIRKEKENVPGIWKNRQNGKSAEEAYFRFLSAFFLSIQTEVFYLCLDGFQVISNERICRLIDALMEYGRGKLKLLISVKGEIPPFLVSDLMEEQVLVIGPKQLRFGVKETGQLLKRITGSGLQKQLVEDVQKYTEGWTAGIIFAGMEIRNALPKTVEPAQFDKSYLFDYIFHEIFRRLSDEIQVFLTESSVLEEMDASLCDYALERSDSKYMLDAIVRKKLFISGQKEERCLYRYDAFFADFLRSVGKAGREEQILCRGAEYYARCKEWGQSVSLGMRCRESVRKKLPETTLFYMYQFCRQQGEEEQGKALLSIAADKAFQNGHYERYAEYMCAFAGDISAQRDISRAKALLAEAEKKLAVREIDSAAGLRVKCLGIFEVTGPLGKAVWRTKKTGELFACLFFEEGRGVKKDILMERLWPEVRREKASVLFHTTVSYLRKALARVGVVDILIVDNQTYAVDFSRIESDMERLMAWNACAKEGRLPADRDVLEAAELYHECYMYGEDYAWLGGQREYVEQVFLQTVGMLARIQMETGEFGKAVLLLEKGIQVDCYAISLAELLVECLLLTGDVRRAKQQYRNIRRICREELCMEPDVKFQDFLRRAENRKNQAGC